MRGKTLVVLRLSHPGLVELDVVKGEGASTELGLVIIHKGHMRASVCPPETIEGVVEVAKQGVRRGAYLEGHRPSPILATGAGAPCKAGQVEEDDLGDPVVVVCSSDGTEFKQHLDWRPLPALASDAEGWAQWAQKTITDPEHCHVLFEEGEWPELLLKVASVLRTLTGGWLVAIPAPRRDALADCQALHVRFYVQIGGQSPIWWCVPGKLWAAWEQVGAWAASRAAPSSLTNSALLLCRRTWVAGSRLRPARSMVGRTASTGSLSDREEGSGV